jgi:hypothetical protein
LLSCTVIVIGTFSLAACGTPPSESLGAPETSKQAVSATTQRLAVVGTGAPSTVVVQPTGPPTGTVDILVNPGATRDLNAGSLDSQLIGQKFDLPEAPALGDIGAVRVPEGSLSLGGGLLGELGALDVLLGTRHAVLLVRFDEIGSRHVTIVDAIEINLSDKAQLRFSDCGVDRKSDPMMFAVVPSSLELWLPATLAWHVDPLTGEAAEVKTDFVECRGGGVEPVEDKTTST